MQKKVYKHKMVKMRQYRIVYFHATISGIVMSEYQHLRLLIVLSRITTEEYDFPIVVTTNFIITISLIM